MFTMKTSAHTDTYHAYHRDGTRALCRSNLKPAAWSSLVDDGMDRRAQFVQSGDTFKRSCSPSRVNCLACQRKLATELAVAEETAHAWNASLVRIAASQAHSFPVLTSRSVGVAVAMTTAGYLERVTGATSRYRLTALGRRAAGLKVHTLVSKINGQEYAASGVSVLRAEELTGGEMILVDLGHVIDFSRVVSFSKSWIPAHVEWRGVRCNRPRQILEVQVIGSGPEPLTYRLDDRLTVAS